MLVNFIIFNALNVLIQTIKSIATVKCGKTVASIVNAIAYGLYTYIVILMSCDLPLIEKCLIIGVCNLIGVFVVKLFEEKLAKEKLWRIDLTVNANHQATIEAILKDFNLSYYYNEFGKHTMFSVFCATKDDSQKVVNIVKEYNGKYFVNVNGSVLK